MDQEENVWHKNIKQKKIPSKLEKQQKFFQIVKTYKDKKMSTAGAGKQNGRIVVGGRTNVNVSCTQEYTK